MNHNKYSIRLIQILSVVLNIAAFLMIIAMYPPCAYTNDDYRMMTIVAGAYTGNPSADIVFMSYPVGLLLASLYLITSQIPWYGIFTILCMFVPSCIFCYYIVKKAYLKNRTVLGIVLYVLLFLFLIRKYICLPQFTLTSAFMGVGTAVLLHEMPAENNKKHILLAVVCSIISFSIRSKAFYMLVPLYVLIMIIRVMNKKSTNLRKSFLITSLSVSIVCGCILVVDYSASNRNEEYQYFEEFNEARSDIYDYGTVPFYYDNVPFYLKNDISEVTYRALSARFLDLDSTVDANTLQTIADYMKDIRENGTSFGEKLKIGLEENIEYWLDAGDEIVKYSTVFVLLLLTVVLTLSMKRKQLCVIFPVAAAGLLLESLILILFGRIVVRIVDMLLLTLGVMGCLAVIDVLKVRKNAMKKYWRELWENKKKLVPTVLVLGSVLFVAYSIIVSLNIATEEKYYSVTETQNSRAYALRNYAKLHPDCFFFYDSSDFISCTEYIFKTYDEGEILNHDSLGSWNIGAPTYYERNAQFGFASSIEGLVDEENEVYFVTTSSPKLGMTKLLKERYNKILMLADTISSDNYNLYIYMVVDDD